MVKIRLGLRQFIKHIYFTFIKIIFLFIERSAISDGDNAWLEAVAGTRLDTVAWYVVRGTRDNTGYCSVVRGTRYVVRGTRLDRVAAIWQTYAQPPSNQPQHLTSLAFTFTNNQMLILILNSKILNLEPGCCRHDFDLLLVLHFDPWSIVIDWNLLPEDSFLLLSIVAFFSQFICHFVAKMIFKRSDSFVARRCKIYQYLPLPPSEMINFIIWILNSKFVRYEGTSPLSLTTKRWCLFAKIGI